MYTLLLPNNKSTRDKARLAPHLVSHHNIHCENQIKMTKTSGMLYSTHNATEHCIPDCPAELPFTPELGKPHLHTYTVN